MVTVRHIEKLWNGGQLDRLMAEILGSRPEASQRLRCELSGKLGAAAMALVRLDELAQAHVPLYSRLVKLILAEQESDGGWGDPLVTAICLRALIAGRGDGVAIERGLLYLAQLQKADGIWPKIPLRRMPADAFVSAFILFQLGGDERFVSSVRFKDALDWFAANQMSLDAETRRLWSHAAARCRPRHATVVQSMLSWS